MVYELSDDDTDMQKRVGVVRECMGTFVTSAFVWFSKYTF
jgi:hypothetical protein